VLLRWTPAAFDDLEEIVTWIEQRGRDELARRIAESIVSALEQLQQFPELGRPTRRGSTRELVIAGLPYVCIYRIRDDRIEVIRIKHGAQEPR